MDPPRGYVSSQLVKRESFVLEAAVSAVLEREREWSESSAVKEEAFG
jgi:hypothetical protein